MRLLESLWYLHSTMPHLLSITRRRMVIIIVPTLNNTVIIGSPKKKVIECVRLGRQKDVNLFRNIQFTSTPMTGHAILLGIAKDETSTTHLPSPSLTHTLIKSSLSDFRMQRAESSRDASLSKDAVLDKLPQTQRLRHLPLRRYYYRTGKVRDVQSDWG